MHTYVQTIKKQNNCQLRMSLQRGKPHASPAPYFFFAGFKFKTGSNFFSKLHNYLIPVFSHWPVGQTVTRSSLEREV